MDQVLAKLKAAHKSLQVWFNSLIATITLAIPYLVDSIPALHDYVPENIYKTAMGVLIVGNILIHFRPTARRSDVSDTGK